MGQNGDVCALLSGRCAPILVSLSDGGLGSNSPVPTLASMGGLSFDSGN
jgi:hypothetical protein